MPLEDYVEATILSEFAPAGGDPAAVERMLEVQAVIGRTYAIGHLGRHAREGYDVCDRTHCQLYQPGRLTTSRWAPQARRRGPADGVPGALVRRRAGARRVSRRLRRPHERRRRGVGRHGPPVPGEPRRRWRRAEAHASWRYEATAGAVRDALNARCPHARRTRVSTHRGRRSRRRRPRRTDCDRGR